LEQAAVSQDIAVELDQLGHRLQADGIEVSGALAAVRVGVGQSNLTYRVRDQGGGSWIVRRPPRGHLLASAHDVLRECRILRSLVGTTVPVPEVVASHDDRAIADTPVVVLEDVSGLVVDQMPVAERLGEPIRRAIGPALVRALAEIHRVDVDAVGLGDLASRAPYAARQLRRWAGQWEQSRTRDLPRLDAMTDLLRRRMPEEHESRLVHGDYHLRNVILEPATGAVRAVLDWELSTLGHPLADMGSLLAYWPEADDGPTLLFAASALPGFATRDQLASAYVDLTGRSRAELDYWHVLGLWKIAIIAEGVLRRALDDPRNAAQADVPTAESVRLAVERAWDVAAASGLDQSSS
jgi:aminoglycoside phosphotransferase (APT) family kinase protein